MNASEEEWREMLYNSVECELCNEPYAEAEDHTPRLLNCGHTFCHSCLSDWASSGSSSSSAQNAIQCPSCRRETVIAPEGLPKNFEVLRIRDELEQWTSERLAAFRAQSEKVIEEKEKAALEAERAAQIAQQEAEKAAERAQSLQRQVASSTREKQEAISASEKAHARAIQAVVRAEELQNETEVLKRQVEWDAIQLHQIKKDASCAAAIAADLQTKADALQAQVDRVKSQLSLHSGKHDPTRMVVLVCEPITVGSWLLPYTRYTVICIANEDGQMDPMRAAKEWVCKSNYHVPQLASVKVYRRYSDFVWLHETLCDAFPGLFVPFLPEKHFFNNNSDFVSDRMRSLQAFLREVLRSPDLCRSDATRSFLLLSTEELEKFKATTEKLPNARDVVVARAKSPPSSTHSSSWLAPAATGQWAWGAMSKLTSKLATKAGLQSVDETPVDSEQAWMNLRRKSYQQLCALYQAAAEKGAIVLKLERKQARDWIFMGQGMDQVAQLDNRKPTMSAEMMTFGMALRGVPDVTEHAIQETLRMHVLHLGAIEQGFVRVTAKEALVEELQQAVDQEVEASAKELISDQVRDEKARLERQRTSIADQLKQLEPQRSFFVAKSFVKSCEDMLQLATESRQAWEALRDRLLRVDCA
ncbi:hypothetical protein H310_01452 [Aphanomyces invadans]|uniref:RING-type domain-containing protein n=1 Tax=Aphanomyces invadans TaxID=157072 RepID=A0A024URS0_9STRA|nr:hypothetical protein H310_01452 [Aphanomyces invadans]ETW08974.1 hypothetical protein H310_01452 [Aphanomyces invadans]|eukprot:XP_008862779.1 hypothetical protein H310_01452 [Aphanomyces invadans]